MADYIARHGESTANRDRVFAGGELDAPLTERGIEQAGQLAREVLCHEVDFTRIISSEMQRARRTARPVAAILGPDIELVSDERLNEYGLGSLSGKPIDSVSNDEVIHAAGAEDPIDFQLRVVEAVTAWSEPGINTLFIAHNSVIRVLKTRELGVPPWMFRELTPVANAQLYRVKTELLV